MSFRAAIPIAALFLGALASTVLAADYSAGTLHISHAWSRPAPPGAAAAIGYMRITNSGKVDDILTGGASPDVGQVEVHEMSFNGGIMRMRPVEGGLHIKPGETVTLGPSGYHLMLIGPKRAFRLGEHIHATLIFARAGAVPITFDVEQPGAEAGMMHGASQ